MSDPVLVYNANYIYFTCDRDPTGTEPIISGYSIPSNWLFYWWNTTTNDIFICQNGSSTPLVWWKQASSLNIASMISSNGWKLNTNRSYSSHSISFNVARTPNITNDTFVIISLSLTSTLLNSETVQLQVDPGSGFVTIGTVSISGVAATNGQSMSAIVPANSQYKLVSSGGGSSSIISTFELTL